MLEGTPTGFCAPPPFPGGWAVGRLVVGGAVVGVEPAPPPVAPDPPLPLPPPTAAPAPVPADPAEAEILAEGLGVTEDFLPDELDPHATVRATTPIGTTSFLSMCAAPVGALSERVIRASAGANLGQTHTEY